MNADERAAFRVSADVADDRSELLGISFEVPELLDQIDTLERENSELRQTLERVGGQLAAHIRTGDIAGASFRVIVQASDDINNALDHTDPLRGGA